MHQKGIQGRRKDFNNQSDEIQKFVASEHIKIIRQTITYMESKHFE